MSLDRWVSKTFWNMSMQYMALSSAIKGRFTFLKSLCVHNYVQDFLDRKGQNFTLSMAKFPLRSMEPGFHDRLIIRAIKAEHCIQISPALSVRKFASPFRSGFTLQAYFYNGPNWNTKFEQPQTLRKFGFVWLRPHSQSSYISYYLPYNEEPLCVVFRAFVH